MAGRAYHHENKYQQFVLFVIVYIIGGVAAPELGLNDARLTLMIIPLKLPRRKPLQLQKAPIEVRNIIKPATITHR